VCGTKAVCGVVWYGMRCVMAYGVGVWCGSCDCRVVCVSSDVEYCVL
jgi:hypothetical protein